MPKLHSEQFALQLIYSIFLGVMFAAFVGIGVWTFYPSPSEAANYDPYGSPEIRTLEAKRSAIASIEWEKLTEAQKDEIVQLDLQIQAAYDELYQPTEAWSINTSVILLVLAAAGMALSLVQSERLLVLSNGLLLGGIFTTAYGTVWAITGSTSTMRFWVVAGATVITLTLGYLRLVRIKSTAKLVAEPADAAQVARVEKLERRIAAAKAAVSG